MRSKKRLSERDEWQKWQKYAIINIIVKLSYREEEEVLEDNRMMNREVAGDLEKETELLREEAYEPKITNQTTFLTLICC